MSDTPTVELQQGSVLAERYRVGERWGDDASRPVFLGLDTVTSLRVRLFAVTREEADALRPAIGTEHAHLDRVLEVAAVAGGFVAIIEHNPGPTLSEVLRQVDRETPIEAVRSALRLADAACALHHVGAAHGFITPAAVIVAPEGHSPPRLTYAPPLPAHAAYRSPERGSGPPSTEDDAWALACLLHEMVLGEPAPTTGLTGPELLQGKASLDDELAGVIAEALATDSSLRMVDLNVFKRALARWFVQHSSEEFSSASLRAITKPPPLPPGAPVPVASEAPPSVAVRPPPSPPSRLRLVALVGGAFLLAIGAAWGISAARRMGQVTEAPARPSADPAVAPSASAASIELGDIPVTGEQGVATGNEMATCVAGYLPKGAFGEPPDFGWVCAQKDPLEGATKLHSALVSGKPPGPATDAMKIYSRLDWYALGAYAVVYSACCPDSAPLELPAPGEGCSSLADPLNHLGRDVVAARPHEQSLADFTAAAQCEAKANRSAKYRRQGPPTSAGEAAFKELVQAIQAP